MFRAMLFPTLLLGLSVAAAAPSTDTQVAELLERVRGMHVVLMRLDQADGPAARALMEQHWRGTQDYMASLLRVTAPAAPRKGAADCRVGATWTPLALPAEVDVYLYRAVMTALDQRMRVELAQVRASESPAERTLRLQAHWNAAYQDLQHLRGLGWMFSRWMPAERDGRVLPEPDTPGARHVEFYCTQCHAVPPPSLHSAREWQALAAAMKRHMARPDTPIPICVTVMPEPEARTLLEYLQRHAR